MKNKWQWSGWSGWVCLLMHRVGKFLQGTVYVMGLFDNGLLSFYKWSISKAPPQSAAVSAMHDSKNIASCSCWRMFLTYCINYWFPVEVMITFSKGE